MKVMNQPFGLGRFRLEEAVISRLLDGGVEERAFVMDIYTGNVILTTIYSYILYVTCCLLSLSSYHIVTIIYSHLYIYHFLPLAIVVRIEALRH